MGFPHQQIDQFTAEVWWDTLKDYTREDVARALARCLGNVEFISCYALVEAIKDDKRERLIGQSTALPLPPRNREVPPEWKAIREVLERSKTIPGEPGHMLPAEVRKRLDELARYHQDRLTDPTTAPRRPR